MAASNRRHILSCMEEHAVFWRDSSDPGAVFGGGAVVERGGLRLRGSDGRARVVETVPAGDVEGIEPGAEDDSIAEFPSLRLDLRNGRSIVLAAAVGGAMFAELVDSLTSLIA